MPKRIISFVCLLLSFNSFVRAQDQLQDPGFVFAEPTVVLPQPDEVLPAGIMPEMYYLRPGVDIPIVTVGTIWSLYAFTKIYSKDPTPLADIQNLNPDDINGIDRWVAGNSSETADKVSDYLFYGSIPVPLLLLADRGVRNDAAKVGFLFWEAFAITGMAYTGSVYFTDRYRPETYNTDVPAEHRTSGGFRNSFFAGHVALVGTGTFFAAKIFNDYHPNSNMRYVFFGAAAVATGTTAYLRHRAGKHFPTDIVIGSAVGVLSGILVPHFHKNKALGGQALRLSPSFYNGGYGLSAVYTIK